MTAFDLEDAKMRAIARDPLKGADVVGVPSFGQCYSGDCFEAWGCEGEICMRECRAAGYSSVTIKLTK